MVLSIETMDYETLLNEAYENVEPTEVCSRFEVIPVKGHHEGIRTVITNYLQVASCMRRDPMHLMKFLSKELASSAEVKGERLILSRKLASKDVNEKIAKYVKCYVTCQNCSKPDTELADSGAKMSVRCLACGTVADAPKL